MGAQTEIPYYNFSRGINTEGSLINFPEGFSSDEVNYDLYIDGSRRRRKGLGLETDGEYFGSTTAGEDACVCFKWNNVANNPEINFIILQKGQYLHLYEDESPLSPSKLDTIINLDLRKVGSTLTSDVAASPVDITFGRGHMFVAGKYIHPFWVSFNPDTDEFVLTNVDIRERDFAGIDDGVAVTAQPVTPTNSHTYNLYNRGWKTADLTAFRVGQPNEPSKAMISWLGYRRQVVAGFADADGTKQFSDAKLIAELFQDASAPQGHFIVDPFNTASLSLPEAVSSFAITTWTHAGIGTTTITVTTDGNHGLAPGNTVQISGQLSYYLNTLDITQSYTFNGTRSVTATPALNQFQFTHTIPADWAGWSSQYAGVGTVTTNVVSNPSGDTVPVRPVAVAFFAGRAWFAGTNHEKLSSKIFFSQIIESDAQYGKCYQVADPTDERISDILPSDGGTIVIPEMMGVNKLVPYGDSLLIFAYNGIWQVSGTDLGYFTATAYGVRKISDNGSVSGLAVVMADNVPHYCGTTDIYRIAQDKDKGFLFTENVSEFTIHTLYAGIPNRFKVNIQGEYDDLQKRIIWLFGKQIGDQVPLAFNYNAAFQFNLRLQAFTLYAFPTGIASYVSSLVAIKDETNTTRKLKYVGITGTRTQLAISECNSEDFIDFEIAEQDAYMVTGPVTLGDAAKFKYAPYVWVFSKKTETGYVDVGPDLDAIGESSTKMQARWDWADLSAAGKWGTEQEVYRHRRYYQPVNSSDLFADGQPMVVTKNKVRGRGRALQLKFQAGDGKDSWISGWQVKYDVHTER